MEEDFELPVQYNGKERSFTARLLPFGYSYKIDVEVNDSTVSFERDEEKNWRALVKAEDSDTKMDKALLAAIVHALEEHF